MKKKNMADCWSGVVAWQAVLSMVVLLGVVAWEAVVSMVVLLNRKQYCLARLPWHYLQARPNFVAQLRPNKWVSPINHHHHHHRRQRLLSRRTQTEVDLVCDLLHRETSL